MDLDYERGLQTLAAFCQPDNLNAWNAFQLARNQLMENIHKAHLFGDTESLRQERSQIIYKLNPLALHFTRISFTDMCLGKRPSLHTAVTVAPHDDPYHRISGQEPSSAMAILHILLFYGGDTATVPREDLLNWLRTPRVQNILGRSIEARKVSDCPAHSDGSVDARISAAITWADKAIALITPDARSVHGAPNVLEEIGRWREKKGGHSLAIVRHHTVPVHSNQAGIVYMRYHDDTMIVHECGERLLEFLQQDTT